jgi:microcin C transport system permease protein
VRYDKGQEKDRQVLDSTADAAALDAESETALRRIVPSPAPPNWQSRHYLGTDSSGNDLVAAAYGGFQLILGTSLYYIIIVYLVGIMLGCLMGYFGGWVDLGGQRLVEIWASIPLLFIVILIRSVIESPSVLMVVSLLAVFGWIGISAYMRTGTMREKARDYVAASQLQGASTTRMIVHHIVPNTLATIVTLIPFTITGLVFSLTSLDYLSFGLPPGAPSWGHLLKDGTDNLAASWIVLTGFGALVLFLLLVTFVGEAIREAFDPKKFTTYR